jgi:Trp operon repressor
MRNNFFIQSAGADAAMSDEMKKFRELASKHNVRISTLVHDSLELEGRDEDIKAFYTELGEK